MVAGALVIVLFFLVAFAVAGLLAGHGLAWAARRIPILGRWFVYAPLLPILVVAISQGAILTMEAFRYEGRCSGFGDSGSRPCTMGEYLFQDFEFGLILGLVPSLIGAALAFAAFAQAQRRGKPQPPPLTAPAASGTNTPP